MNITSEHHFDLTFRFAVVQAHNLIRALTEVGITDEKKVRSVLESFLFSMAEDFDESFIRDPALGNKKYYPMICFRDQEEIGKTEQIVFADGQDAFHETLPFGVVDTVLDPEDNKLGFTYGNEASEVDL